MTKLEKQIALEQNEQSAIETNKLLVKKLETAKQAIKELAMNSELVCEYCKYNIPCLAEECEHYVEGVGMHDENGKYFDWKWSCMDFDFGTCKKFENTPCNGCFSNEDLHVEWNGKAKGE